MDNLPNILHQIFLRSPLNLFDEFILECQKWYSLPAHTFLEMRKRDNKKIRGDIFEEFCVLYLTHILNYNQVWRLENVPEDLLIKLSLKRRDMGIDIICEHDGNYFAVQCKYKKHTSYRKHSVSWKELSTFYALCLRSGFPGSGWEKYIVMTNCEFVNHMGKKTEKDQSICIGTFRNISKEDWIKMCNLSGHTVSDSVPETNVNIELDKREKLRALRLAYFDKK
jgi:predicted helicase